MLVFSCSSCGAKLQMGEELAGKKVRCSSCQAVVTAPERGAGEEAITAASPTAVAGGASKSRAASDAVAARDDRGERRPMPRRDGGSGSAAKAAGMSIGVILAIVGVVGCCGVTLVGGTIAALVIPAVAKVREAAARTQTMNNMKQIGLAQHNYASVHGGKLPTPKRVDVPGGEVDLSWRVDMLPYIEQDILYRQFDLKSAWNNPRNDIPSNTHVAVYDQILRDGAEYKGSATYFQYFTGEKTMWPTNTGMFRIGNIPDGTSNTFDFADADMNMPWANGAGNMVVEQGRRLPLPKDRFFVAMWDGSVHVVDRSRVPEATFRLYIDPADGAAVPLLD